VHTVAEPLTNHRKLCNYAEPKPFPFGKPTYFDFSSFHFTEQDHMLSTAGDDALTVGTQRVGHLTMWSWIWQCGLGNLWQRQLGKVDVDLVSILTN
jgi:hypothetical protein